MSDLTIWLQVRQYISRKMQEHTDAAMAGTQSWEMLNRRIGMFQALKDVLVEAERMVNPPQSQEEDDA